MQVNQVTDTITHAVIGNQDSVEMGVSDSAALMHIFSTALYTYPSLATIREIMCNGWDAHISAGLTDTPLEVTINQTHVTIRDFGLGIPHDKIGPIYGMFGDSTKRNDSTVTGGFGLGSKAPFAYVDDFEVISCHEGKKTVYVMSKSSMEVGGKPSIKTIISVPTTEQGIQVKFALKTGHYDKFLKHITEVRTLGQIPTKLNGTVQDDHLPLLESPTGYLISSFRGTNTQKINLRYGNVVYPIPPNDAYKDLWDKVALTMGKLWDSANVIFMAEPDSITIAPSRESLILTDGTVRSIKAMLAKFDTQTPKAVSKTVGEMLRHEANKAVKNQTYSSMPIAEVFPASLKAIGDVHTSGAYAYTVRRAALHYAVANVRHHERLGEEVILRKQLDMHIQQKLVNVRMAKAIRSIAYNHKRPQNLRDSSGYKLNYMRPIQEHVIAPVRKMIQANEKFAWDRFYYASVGGGGAFDTYTLRQMNIRHLRNAMAYLKPKVLLVRSKTAAQEFFSRWMNVPVNQMNHGNLGWFVYICGVTEATQEMLATDFRKLGFEVHKNIPERALHVRAKNLFVGPPAPKEKVIKRKGYPTLAQSYAYDSDVCLWYFTLGNARKACTPGEEITDPIMWVELYPKGHRSKRFGGFTCEESVVINQLWGDQIAVVTAVQSDALKKRGIPSVSEYVMQYADTALSAKEDFRRYLAFSKPLREGHMHNSEAQIFMEAIKHESLMKSLGLRFTLSPETVMLVSFFEGHNSKHMPLCADIAAKVKPHPLVNKSLEKMGKSPYKRFLDFDRIRQVLNKKMPDSPETDAPYHLVQLLMK